MLNRLKEKQRSLIRFIQVNQYIRKEFKDINNSERLVALIGARGVGKTTLLLQYLQQFTLDEALYFSADDITIANFGIFEIVEEFYKLGGRIVVIDEVHIYKDWASHIKNLYDFYPDLIIRISGSSMLNILMQSYDLSRRIVIKELKILSFKEYLEITYSIKLTSLSLADIVNDHIDISFELVQQYPSLFKDFKNYLRSGCYPYFLSSSNENNYLNKLFNSIEKIIFEDIPSTNKIKFEHLQIFKKLIYKIAVAKVPFQVKIDSLARDLEISEPTLYSYLDILNKTGIFKSIKKYSLKTSRKPAKIFFSNTNMLTAIMNDLNIPIEIGILRETFFVSIFDNLFYSHIGDFKVNQFIYEIGGKNKDFKQIKNTPNSFLVLDIDTSMDKRKIPLWLFGFI